MEGDGDWTYAREGKYNPRIAYPHKLADRGITVIWFPDLKGARGFNNNKHRNRFYERGFPTQHDYESVYVPAINPPVFSKYIYHIIISF